MTDTEIQQWRAERILHPQTTFQALVGPDAGDCMRAAIATLLQIDPAELTNWMSLETDGWSLVMERELEAHGWYLYPFLGDTLITAGMDPDVPCVLTGPTPSGFAHCVVGTVGGQLLWDPLGGETGLASVDQSWLLLDHRVPGLRRGFTVMLGERDEWHH